MYKERQFKEHRVLLYKGLRGYKVKLYREHKGFKVFRVYKVELAGRELKVCKDKIYRALKEQPFKGFREKPYKGFREDRVLLYKGLRGYKVKLYREHKGFKVCRVYKEYRV